MKKVYGSILPVALAISMAMAIVSSSGIKLPGRAKPVPVKPVQVKSLPVVGSHANFKALLAKSQASWSGPSGGGIQKGFFVGDAVAETAPGAPQAAVAVRAGNAGGDYSTTNVQVAGVDEADVVKTDGKYIYRVTNQRVVVALAQPAAEMKLVSTLEFAKNFSPIELYVDKKHLVVVGSSYTEIPLPGGTSPQPAPAKPEPAVSEPSKPAATVAAPSIRPGNPGMPPLYPPVRTLNTLKVVIYDLSDMNNIKKVREAELDGNYVSSRKIGSALYLVTNKYIDYYSILQQSSGDFTPVYRDTAVKDKYISVPYSDIRYFPDLTQPNFLLVAGLNVEQPGQEMDVSTYLGSGQNIMASQENLYVAVTRYETEEPKTAPSSGTAAGGTAAGGPVTNLILPGTSKSITKVYKFNMAQGKVKFTADGEVPGTVLNQFSMDENEGYFRIATTKGEVWGTGENTSKNNVYVLDGTMKTVGKLEDIAPGEKIYSVRFIGDRGYMVTFKTVDPLFVIDLKDPKAPAVLGALKIPGYSDYLHPYDENHIIGFGKDTVEMSQKDQEGNTTGNMAFYQGLKMAVFDVSDVSRPVEQFREIIGDRGTDSELLHNHKALLFSKDKNLLAFPVTLMEVPAGQTQTNGIPAYGQFTYQGAYIYNLDLTNGFKLKGRVTHLDGQDNLKAGYGWYESGKNVDRIIYIGDTLYTMSSQKIMANDLNSLNLIKSLDISK